MKYRTTTVMITIRHPASYTPDDVADILESRVLNGAESWVLLTLAVVDEPQIMDTDKGIRQFDMPIWGRHKEGFGGGVGLETQEQQLDDVRQIIKEEGVMIQAVFPTVDDDGPPFCYTVGLAAHDHPELIIFGLDADTAAGILNFMSDNVIKDHGRWEIGTSDQIFTGVPARLIEVSDSNKHLTMANLMFAIPGQGPLPALQILYPDKDGRWPWEPESGVADRQPVVGEVI